MSGGVVGRVGLKLVLGLSLLACNTFDPPAGGGTAIPGADFGDPGPAPSAGFGGFFGSAGAGVAGVPALPPPILQITGRMPAPDARDVDVYAPIVITFTLPVEPNTGTLTVSHPDGSGVPVLESVEGLTLRLQPLRPLEPNTTYRVHISMFTRANDSTHIAVRPAEQSWAFTTRAASEAIDVGVELKRVVYDAASHRVIGLPRSDERLVALDLATRAPAMRGALVSGADDLCLTPDGKRLFVAYLAAPFFTEHDPNTLEQIRQIAWPATHYPAPEAHVHVRCTDTQLLLVDGQWQPALWTFAFDASAPVDRTGSVQGIGDLAPTGDGDEFYYWWQLGWNAGSADSVVHRVSLADFASIDATEVGHPNLPRDPLDAPLILDEARERIITKNYVVDSLDLTTILFEFTQGETIYAADLPRQRAASRLTVYSLETFLPIADTLSARAAQQFFDRDGALYYLVNDQLIVQRF